MEFKDRLKEAIDTLGIRVAKLSDNTGIARSLLYKYIRGDIEPSLKSLGLLARSLNVSEAWLMGYDVEKERPCLLTDEVVEVFRTLSYSRQEQIVNLIYDFARLG